MKRALFFLLSFVLLMTAIPAYADTIVVGGPATSHEGLSYPFGYAYNGEYQQVYTHSLFSDSITITGMEFYNTQYNSSSSSMPSGTWTVSLSTTQIDWDTVTSTFSDNIGSNNTQVFSGNLTQAWAFGNTLHINFSTPFTYDPTKGNLLMDVVGSGVSMPSSGIWFDTNFSSTSMSRVSEWPGYGSSVYSGSGLVTGFNVSSVPVPASLLLFAPGLLGLFGLKRKMNA